ncbi:MAG: SRPBCC domain-containing protein [Bacteroidetes bacterium]|nr:SRPBCC domain-containing protein [Bacteroidota bacterium]
MNTSTSHNDRMLKVTRLFDAPISMVWDVWTKPEHIINWWGPNGFRTEIHKMDLVADGEWLLSMYGPDGQKYPNKSIFMTIEAQKRIIFRHFHPDFVTTVEFEARGNQTFMQWQMLFDTKEELDTVVKTFKADEGLKQNVEKLAEYLQRITH